ncbi:CDP-alcohol phosphatidyltransferase family protein [Halanaerobiaceae bacterium Z-7014]|uniref:CDP-alcohol phosphatidyltransferase family protein n=1 Tax=Halonatronomonas betaini TaxID=2778430 RepID=A0A931ARE4_9FIRM|nr:CDP-alcohol phosphatidyltransferase family protein [Halonatronomonas betaini]MBF8435480.1 CDP-alcohol phosphatidyltransferase family protein [Halonatronomonas betaini]
MLDTYARKYFDFIINSAAKFLSGLGLSSNQVTIIAGTIGILTGLLVYLDMFIAAIILLWLSGFLDSVDGAIARLNNKESLWGTVLDITFDRVVEISFIIGLAFRFPEVRLNLLFMTTSIILSMTIFLTVGAVSEKSGEKSFRYQVGLMERTEGFILFTVFLVLPDLIYGLTILYAVLVLYTAIQRFQEARKLLKSPGLN